MFCHWKATRQTAASWEGRSTKSRLMGRPLDKKPPHGKAARQKAASESWAFDNKPSRRCLPGNCHPPGNCVPGCCVPEAAGRFAVGDSAGVFAGDWQVCGQQRQVLGSVPPRAIAPECCFPDCCFPALAPPRLTRTVAFPDSRRPRTVARSVAFPTTVSQTTASPTHCLLHEALRKCQASGTGG